MEKTMKAQITKYFADNDITETQIIDLDTCVRTKGKNEVQIIEDVFDVYSIGWDFEVTNVEIIKEEKEDKKSTGRVASRLGYGEDEGDYVPHNTISSIITNSK